MGLYYESLPESMLVYVKGKIFFKDHHLNKLNPCNRMDRKYEKKTIYFYFFALVSYGLP